MTLVQTEPKSIKIGTTNIKKVTIRPNGTEKQIRPVIPPYLCFTANTAGSTVQLTKNNSPTAVTLETSTDGSTWSTYTFGNIITLTNIGDKVYFRNTSDSNTAFSSISGYYKFVMTGSIAASGDVTSLINKNCTDTIADDGILYGLFIGCNVLTTPPRLPATTVGTYAYYYMFQNCRNMTKAPILPATTLAESCYSYMFNGCTSLEEMPELPATTLPARCYLNMFNACSKIKLSTTQTGEYQTPYRMPKTGTGTAQSNSFNNMFKSTGGTFTGTPTINTTYYTSNTVI